MGEEKLTEQEIINYVDSQSEYLNMTPEESEKYTKFIMKTNDYKNWHNKIVGNAIDFFELKFNKLYDLFLQEGYSKDASLNLAKHAVLHSDRKNFITYLNLLRMLDFEEKVINGNVVFYKSEPEKIHAKKCFFLDNNYISEQNISNLTKITDKNFGKKFKVNVTSIIKKYPLTKETISIWSYLASLTDEKLFKEFKLTRNQMSYIYPTTNDELSVLKKIANLTDDEITEKYGISRDELLKKHPLNNDTLRALKAIQATNDEKTNRLFNKLKDEVLHLRTITTEMIMIANQNVKLKRDFYTKEELKEKLKSMKKGTNPNG